MISWKETLKRLAEDKSRLLEHYRTENIKPPIPLIFNPSYLSVVLFRLSYYFHSQKRGLLAWAFWFLNLRLTGANIYLGTEVRGGLFLNIPLGVTLYGSIGRNCTVGGNSVVIKNCSKKDVGAGPGLPVIGDNVFIKAGAIVHGPVIIGNNSSLGSRCLIETDLPENSIIELREPIKRVLKNDAMEGLDQSI